VGEPLKFHPEVLVPDQTQLLAQLSSVSQKWGAYLAGGAAIALQLGHRRSVDFDWFTRRTLPPAQLVQDLEALKVPLDVRQNKEGTFLARVGGVDFSVFRYKYELVGRPVTYQGCEVASLQDIAAMKMTAIVQRAVKRDYVDLHLLFSTGNLSLREVIATMERKFAGLDPAVAVRAMTYFKDVEDQAMPAMLVNIKWDEVKAGLVRARDRGLSR